MNNTDAFNIITPSELGKHIELLKINLGKVVQEYGINSKETLTLSQELDQYIILCQRCCPKAECN